MPTPARLLQQTSMEAIVTSSVLVGETSPPPTAPSKTREGSQNLGLCSLITSFHKKLRAETDFGCHCTQGSLRRG